MPDPHTESHPRSRTSDPGPLKRLWPLGRARRRAEMLGERGMGLSSGSKTSKLNRAIKRSLPLKTTGINSLGGNVQPQAVPVWLHSWGASSGH